MKVRIVRTARPAWVPIPAALLARSGLTDEVVVEVQAEQIVIRAAGEARRGWEEAFRSMAERGDDTLID